MPVEEDTLISCRFYPASQKAPSILHFHAGSETVSCYNKVVPFYKESGVNWFVASYRGYGQSGGTPSFSNIVSDSHIIFEYFRMILKAGGYASPIYVMGKSLGSLYATELAVRYPKDLKGLIIENGYEGIAMLLAYLGLLYTCTPIQDRMQADLEKLRGVTIRTLIIHGECKEYTPFKRSLSIYDNIGSQYKKLLPIPNLGDYTSLIKDMEGYFRAQEQYFQAIKEFVSSG